MNLSPTLITNLTKYIPGPVYRWLGRRWIDETFPRHIFIETTSSCNLHCNYCPREDRSDHMEWNLFTNIIDECSLYGQRSFSLHLFGEPLLYPCILDAVRYIKSKPQKHKVLLTTNGTHLDRYAKELNKLHLDKILHTYRGIRFKDDSIRLLKRKGVIRFFKGAHEEKDWLQAKEEGYQIQVKELHNYGGHVKSKMETPKRHPCYHLFLAPAVRYNGDFLICCNDPHSSTSLGNLHHTTIRDCWVSKELKEYRESHLNGTYEPNLCKGCNCWSTYPSLF